MHLRAIDSGSCRQRLSLTPGKMEKVSILAQEQLMDLCFHSLSLTIESKVHFRESRCGSRDTSEKTQAVNW